MSAAADRLAAVRSTLPTAMAGAGVPVHAFEEGTLVLFAPDMIDTGVVVDTSTTLAWIDGDLAASLRP